MIVFILGIGVIFMCFMVMLEAGKNNYPEGVIVAVIVILVTILSMYVSPGSNKRDSE